MRVVVLGGGAAGEHFVGSLRRLDPDARLTLVEHHLVGGECSYYACMPSKAMLRPLEAHAAAGRARVDAAAVDPERVFEWRDWMVSGFDDAGQERWLAEQGAELVRGRARVVARGRVDVDGRELEYDRLVVATGSVPVVPELPGLSDREFWTNREAMAATEVPESLCVIGAGAVGCEIAQLYRRLGSQVTLLVRGERLLERVDEKAARLVLDAFVEEGVDVRFGAEVERVEQDAAVLADGTRVGAQRLLVATGRRANVDELGLESAGVRVTRRGVEVDERLRAADGVWAVGDVTGVAQFTHVGKYQARVAAADIAGREARADYRAIPATIFTDPQVATVGTLDGVVAEYELASVPRTSTYEREARAGLIRIAGDPNRGVVTGAVAVGPEAGEWLQQLTVAIRAEVPVETLLDVIQPYPTFSEGVFFALRELADRF